MKPRGKPAPDVFGKTFGNLTVLSRTDKKSKNDNRAFLYEMKCSCGNIVYKPITYVKLGYVRSCGCLHSQTILEKTKAYRASKKYPKESLILRTIKSYKRRKPGGPKWKLTMEEAMDLFAGNCHYCDDPPSNTTKHPNRDMNSELYEEFRYSGIDRVDSSGDYVAGNVVSCCIACNRAKNNSPLDKFEKWMSRIGSKWISKQYPVTNAASVPFHYARLN